MAAPRNESTVERERQALNGWLALLLVMAWFVAGLAVIVSVGPAAAEGALSPEAIGWRIFTGVVMIGLGVFACFGFFTLEPNEARVLILFGAYQGTVRRSGFHWANPLYARHRGAVPGSVAVPRKVNTAPLSLRHKMSSRPSPLKSPTPAMCQLLSTTV